MTDTPFIYVTYIATTPAKVWAALTETELTRQYWGNENISDWKPGSPWEHRSAKEAGKVMITGEVLESKPPNRLALTWVDPALAHDRANHARVVFEIEAVGEMVRLTVTHDRFRPGSQVREKVSNGWPRVLASLKSFLETGRPLDTWA